MSHNKPQSAEAQRKPSRMNTHKKTRLTFKQVKICHLERTCDIWKKKMRITEYCQKPHNTVLK